MLTVRCKICLDIIADGEIPMATQCGHVYCLDCATFHFSQTVCRHEPQTLENMVRLYLDEEEQSVNTRTGDGEDETGIGSSPALGFIIEEASEDAVATMERAIADGHENMQDALLACNTFANSVTPRHRAHDYQKLIRNIHSQITLVQNDLKYIETQVMRLKDDNRAAQANEAQTHTQVEERRVRLDLLRA